MNILWISESDPLTPFGEVKTRMIYILHQIIRHQIHPSEDLPIVLRKSKGQCTCHVSSFVFIITCHLFRVLLSHLSTLSLPKPVHKALSHLRWCNAMTKEMNALDDNGFWNLVNLNTGKKDIRCKWVFAVKVNPDGSVVRLKARLVTR